MWADVYSAVVKSSFEVQMVSKFQADSTGRNIVAIDVEAQIKEKVTPLAIT